MNVLRWCIDNGYNAVKQLIFGLTRKDPQRAHEASIKFFNFLYKNNLEWILGNNSKRLSFELSNAAGFNKDGDIPPTTLRRLGFDRVVVGTVTADTWNGNPRPTIKRYPQTNSLVNWQGLPGIGAKSVSDNLI